MKKNVFALLLCVSAAITLSAQEMVHFNVDVLPTNVGGKFEFKRVFEQELQYPADLLKEKIGGKATFNFSIHKDSSIHDLKLISSGHPALDAEASRLFKKFQWVPAVRQGVFVGAPWTVTFEFNPSKYSKYCRDRGFVTPEYLKDEVRDTSEVIVSNPEQFPMYPKGNFALQDFVKANLEYPRQAQMSNIQGTVVLRFVVETTGLVTNIGIEKSVGGGCDIEAGRVLQMIKWYPAKHNGKLVRAQMTFPFYFILNDEFKDNAAGEQK